MLTRLLACARTGAASARAHRTELRRVHVRPQVACTEQRGSALYNPPPMSAPTSEANTWLIKRNCSAGPRQLAMVFGSLVAVSFAFGLGFAAFGLWMVLPFVGLELIAVGAAFFCYGRHAADFERICDPARRRCRSSMSKARIRIGGSLIRAYRMCRSRRTAADGASGCAFSCWRRQQA